jgi:hypothetical protein
MGRGQIDKWTIAIVSDAPQAAGAFNMRFRAAKFSDDWVNLA